MKFRIHRRKPRPTIELEEAIVHQSFAEADNPENIPHRGIPDVMAGRARAATFLILIVFAAAMLNLGAVRGSFYREKAQANIIRSISVPAVRGVISDRRGKPLVENVPGFRLVAIPGELPQDTGERGRLLEDVGQLIGKSAGELIAEINRHTERYLSEAVIAREVTAEAAVHIRSRQYPGIKLVEDVKRRYLGGEAMAHVMGYVGAVGEEDLVSRPGLAMTDTVGKGGLEAYYDDILRGTNGKRYFEKELETREFRDAGAEPPVAGNSLETTIDAEFQEYFYQSLKNGIARLGSRGGVGIALDPTTGEVLSLVNAPSFDNNWFINPSRYRAEIERTLSSAAQPLFNRAISGLYNPGSTIKPLVGLAGLEEGVIDARTTFEDPGYLLVPNPYHPDTPSVFLDWRAHGPVDLRKALAVSANVFFYITGGGTDTRKGLGIARLNDHFSRFHLNERLGIDLVGEAGGRIPAWNSADRAQPWRLGDTYNTSIGQGDLSISPIGLISYIAAIANGGTVYQPHIAKTIKNRDNEIIKEIPPRVLAEGLGSAENIRAVREGMRDVVRKPYGTGVTLSDLPFTLAGKSGTAQVANKTKLNSLFVAFAPYEQPKIVVLVLIEDARESGLNATPIVKDVLMWYYLNRGL